jgi:hypothetical protein
MTDGSLVKDTSSLMARDTLEPTAASRCASMIVSSPRRTNPNRQDESKMHRLRRFAQVPNPKLVFRYFSISSREPMQTYAETTGNEAEQ